MRISRTLIIGAAGLFAAVPVAAQNATADNVADLSANAAAANSAAIGNEAATPSAPAANTTTTTADTNAMTVSADNSAPAPEKKGFPWGIIGLLGLLGFIPRTRRSR